MKKTKKILILIIFMVLLSGCTATYELNIKDGKVKEKLRLIETNSAIFDVRNDSGWTLREMQESMLAKDSFASKNYKVKSLNNNNQLGLEYTSTNEQLFNSSILNQCYINPVVDIRDGIVTLNTGNNFKCYEYYDNLDEIKIILKTNHEVISTNAEEIHGNSYIWNISKESNKQIEISYYENFTKKTFNWFNVVIIVLILAAISGGIYFLIKKNRKSNSI